MAIDSREKRASAINVLPIVTYPVADGVIDNFDRMQATWLYSGIVVSGGAAPPPSPPPTPEIISVVSGGAPFKRRRNINIGQMIADADRLEEEEIFILM